MNRISSLQSDCECENVTDRDQNARKFFFNSEKTFVTCKEKIFSSARYHRRSSFARVASTRRATAFAQLMHMNAARDRPRRRGPRCLREDRNSGLRVARRDRRMNAAANIEIADDGHFARLAGLNQIVENLVDHGFVESTFVAIGPQIELQRFELDAKLIGDVADSDRGKIRLSCAWTNTGELGTFHVNFVVAFRPRVGEGLELFTRSGCHERILARRKTISKSAT